jgi:hypothetical protein
MGCEIGFGSVSDKGFLGRNSATKAAISRECSFGTEVSPWSLAGAFALSLLISFGAASAAQAESVNVKYRGLVNLAPFACEDITRSSFIERVCYDPKNTYMLIDLKGTWYHYCEIDQQTVSDLLAAGSMGRYYNASIKGRFDCRTHRVPDY